MSNRDKIGFPLIVVLLLAILILALWISKSQRQDRYAENPKVGDIYIVLADDIYSPMKVSRVSKDEIAFNFYLFSFTKTCPDREQLLEEEWSYSFEATYTRSEMNKMYEDGQIVEIYRDK